MKQIIGSVNNNSIEKFRENVILIGPKQGEQKHGHYYYLFDDGTKEYVYISSKSQAGLYDSNNKEGVWKDFVSFSYELDENNNNPVIIVGFKKKQKRKHFQIYVKGNKLSYSQVEDQKEIYLEKIGIYCQLQFSGKLMDNHKIGYWQISYKGQVWQVIFYYVLVEVVILMIKDKKQDNGLMYLKNTIGFVNVQCSYYQITYSGEYKNGIRTGNWITTHDGLQIGGGTYDENGVKQGQWIDLDNNYNYFCQVTYSGEYKDGLRIGKWITIYKSQQIGCGLYEENGIKSGQWIDLHDNYWDECQVTYYGEYKNGLRIGKWIAKKEGEQIGGGMYDENGLKSGQWIDLHENYWHGCKVSYSGEYKNGLKIGKWITALEDKEIGGGIYDQGMKQGQWIDLNDNYNCYCEVTHSGEYRNGIRTGKWKTTYQIFQIGGGLYDENGIKSGQWIDHLDNYKDDCQVQYCGEYKNGLRIGKWITKKDCEEMGGGNYDEKGEKSGQWIELHENYNSRCEVTYSGEYRSGLKIGNWITFDKFQIGGGIYDENGAKSGQWIDLYDNYHYLQKVKQTGEYKNGLRTGKWITVNKGKQIGAGSYDEKGLKSDQWIDLYVDYHSLKKVTQTGEYKNGCRTGKWITVYKGQQIGGGIYDEKGVKSGQWIDLHDNYGWYIHPLNYSECQVTYSGEYKNGLKIGKWIATYKGQQIGGGIYDEKGVKSGQWIDLYNHFWDSRQETYSGEYNNGLRVGQWTVTEDNVTTPYATYDQQGIQQ